MTFKHRQLTSDDKGAAAMELALAAPILAAMLVGLIDLSTAYSHKLRLEQIAQRTIEKVQQDGFTTDKEAALEAEAEAAAGTGADADLTYWLECNGVKQTGTNGYTNGCSSGQVYARYVQVDIERSYTPIIIGRFTKTTSTGSFELHGIAGIRIQ